MAAPDVDALRRQYWEAFRLHAPIYHCLDDEGHARLYQLAIARGEPLGDDDGPDVPDDAEA